jgi:hypothetical protein
MRFRASFLLYLPILWVPLFAQPPQPEAVDTDIRRAKADSLQLQADSLEARASQLERQLDTLENGSDDFKTELKLEVDKIHSEIMAVKDKIAAVVNDIFSPVDIADAAPAEDPPDQDKVVIEERKVKKYYGSFIVALEYTRFDVGPLEHLAENDRSLTGKHFDFSDNQMLTFGLMGYYSKDNSVRVGNGLYAGYKLYHSDVFKGSQTDSLSETVATVDSVITLRVIPTYFGFLCEKAFMYDPVSFFAGIMLGGNLTVVVKEEQEARLVSSFINDADRNDDENGRFSVALSPAVFWDVHGGMGFKLSDNMHFAIDGVLRFAYAYEGFGAGFGDFLSVNPGVRVRLTFGNAG